MKFIEPLACSWWELPIDSEGAVLCRKLKAVHSSLMLTRLKRAGFGPLLTLLIQAAILLPEPLFADLDVAVSPGTPLEWLSEYPFYGPQKERGKSPIYTGRKRKGAEDTETDTEPRGHTYVAPAAPVPERPPVMPHVQDAMSFARIITRDVTGHLPWVSPKKGVSQGKPWMQAWRYGFGVYYPPKVGLDSHWFVMGIVLRFLLHPARISISESRSLLLCLGPQIHPPLSSALQAGPAVKIIRPVLAKTPAIPAKPPPIPALRGVDPFRAMAQKLAVIELGKSPGYTLEERFAPKSRALGTEAVPAFMELLSHPHPLVRENAVLLLAGFRMQAVTGALCKVAAKSQDAVMRARAVYALGNRQGLEVIETLRRLLRSPETRAAAIQSLGRVGGKQAAEAVFSVLRNTGDLDTLFTAVPALGRAKVREDKYVRLLRRVHRKLSGKGKGGRQLVPTGRFRPDNPDPPGLKRAVVRQFALIALARLGDPAARDSLLSLEGKRQQKKPKARRGVSQDPLDPIKGPCTHYFLETLAELGQRPEGRMALEAIIRDIRIDKYVRMYAVWQYPGADNAETEVINELLSNTGSSMLRAAALQSLARLNPDKARESAIEILESFTVGGRKAKGAECVVALKIAGRTGGVPYRLLVLCIEEAKKLKGVRAPKRRNPAPRRMRGGLHKIEITPQFLPYLFIELGKTGDRRAIPVLKKELEDPKGSARGEAALALGAIGGKAPAAALVKALQDGDGWVRYCAFRGLQGIRGDIEFQDWIFESGLKKEEKLNEWHEWASSVKETETTLVEPSAAGGEKESPFSPEREKEQEETEAASEEEPQLDKGEEKTGKVPGTPGSSKDVSTPEGVQEAVKRLVETAESGDEKALERIFREVLSEGERAVPFLISELRKARFPFVVIEALEAITHKQFGFDCEAWEKWWREKSL